MKVEYAIYKGDEFLMIGTAEECAAKMDVKINTVKWLSSGVAWRRFEKAKNQNKRMIALKLD